MSLATDWKKEIADMSRHKIINIDNKNKKKIKSPPRSSSKNRKLSRKSRANRSASSLINDIKKVLATQSYISFIIVFFSFYLLGWYLIFSLLHKVEHESHNLSSASSLYPHGDITHHLPKQIEQQILKLTKLKELTANKGHFKSDQMQSELLKILNQNYNENGLNIEKNKGLIPPPNENGLNLIQDNIEKNKAELPINNNKMKNVAISILISSDPGITGGFLDSAGALIVSIEEAKSIHNIHLIALVHKDVKYCLPILEAMGYEIRSYDTPFQIEDVENKKIGEEMRTDGCCGILETLKLWVWTWSEFDVVLSVDADIHFHQNFDELFELNTTLGWTHGATADKNQELMNGGYLLVRPNIKHFNDMVALLVEGDFRDGSAWKGSGVGWVYGGRTIQGIVPYYYLKVAINDETEFPRCKYNNMVEIDKCRKWNFSDVTSNHFTWCQKPWYCVTGQKQPLCDSFRAHWWERSHKFEIEKLGLEKPREICTRRPYSFINYYESPKFLKFFKENGYDITPPDIPQEFYDKKSKH